LYNLVESTVSECLKRIAQEISDSGLTYGDIREEWQRSWLQEIGQTAESLSPDTRLKKLLKICNDLLGGVPVTVNPKLPAGSLDDLRIEKVLRRHGIEASFSPWLQAAVKRHVVDDNGPLKLVRIRRNELAHGLSSFADCGRNVSIIDLRNWAAIVFWYLKQLIWEFDNHLKDRKFR
jgi:hypothetical protein